MTLTDPPRIELRGVRVHNLQNVNLDIPLGKLVVLTGVGGSGKSSLAFDTLYAEGQRRYIESFSTYDRRFLDRFEKPDADRIEPIPPAVAVRRPAGVASRRATVGTATEIYDSLRLLFARVGIVECPQCRRRIERHSPASAERALEAVPGGRRLIVAFDAADPAPPEAKSPERSALNATWLIESGFHRLILGGKTMPIEEAGAVIAAADSDRPLVVVDRLTTGVARERLADSLELAFRHGAGTAVVLVEAADRRDDAQTQPAGSSMRVDDRPYELWEFSERQVCSNCRREFPDLEPALFNFNSALGACRLCRGLGDVATKDGPRGARDECPACHGARLQPEALAVRVAGRTIADAAQMTPERLSNFVAEAHRGLTADERTLVDLIVHQLAGRVESLQQVGLGYLTFDRALRTLSIGEAQRIRLTAALGSNLVDMLYVLDEPTAGLHPRDTEPLVAAIMRLRDRGNTIVAVSQDTAIIRAADQVIVLGPGAGREGGRIVFQGPVDQLRAAAEPSWTEIPAGRISSTSESARTPRSPTGWLRLEGVEHHNLRDVDVDFPLGVLCAVTGVGGSGKSSLVVETLYQAVAARLLERISAAEPRNRAARNLSRHPTAGRFRSLSGLEQIDAILLIDRSPIGRSGRSNPAACLNLLSEIRLLFAETAEAKVRNFPATVFSYNSGEGGRCATCRGTGSISVDLQFLPDIVLTCPDCRGARFRPEVLEVRYRGLSIAEVLALTVGEAFSFFRGRHRLQRRLKALKDVGLEYLTIGQPADTLSGGETQRVKLAASLTRGARGARTLFLLDEPTIGLDASDVTRLIDTLGQLAAGGNSLVVIDHNLEFVRQADYVIDLGPEAGPAGGRVIARGTPVEVAREPNSITGRFLADRAAR